MFIKSAIVALFAGQAAFAATTTKIGTCSTASGTKKVSPVPTSTVITTSNLPQTVTSTVSKTTTITGPTSTTTVTGYYATITKTSTGYSYWSQKTQTVSMNSTNIYWIYATTACTGAACPTSTFYAAQVTIPAPAGFTGIRDTGALPDVKCNKKRDAALEARATSTKMTTSVVKGAAVTQYPTAVKCTNSVLIDSGTVTSTTTVTSTRTVRSYVTVTTRPTSLTSTAYAYTTRDCTSTGTQTITYFQPVYYTSSTIYPKPYPATTITQTVHEACATRGVESRNYLGPKQLDRNEFLSGVVDSAGNALASEVVFALTEVDCCNACWNTPNCLASGYNGYYSDQCYLYKNSNSSATCSNTRATYKSSPVDHGTWIYSNGKCGGLIDGGSQA